MKTWFKKYLKINISKRKLKFFLSLFLVFGIFWVAPPVEASWAATVVANILGVIISALGLVLTLAIRGLIYIASYSYFLDSGAVSYGWVLVRDICNMFFVIVLLMIAFGTILHIEQYNYKKWLPKLIMMAILINFSKTICGLLIDVAQVLMLTFVNAFKGVAGGSMTTVLGIEQILQFDKNSTSSISFWTVVSAYLLGIIYIIAALIVIVTMMIMLVVRVVMIWIYIVLSPLAYLAYAFPGGQSFHTRWWKEFISNLIIGPVLAFFIWLSFAALAADEVRDVQNKESEKANEGFSTDQSGTIVPPGEENDIGTEAAKPASLIKFVIAIAMLVGGLKIAQEFGGEAGKVVGKGMSSLNKAGKIGMTGVAAVSGYRAAKAITGNYMASRKAKREEGYRVTANKMADKIGDAKKYVGGKVAGTLGKGVDKLQEKVGLKSAGKKAEKNLREAEQERTNADEINKGLTRKDDIKLSDQDVYSYDKENETWTNQNNPGDVKSHLEMEKIAREKADNLEVSASQKEESAVKQQKKQAVVDKAVKLSLGAVAVTVGALTGGIPGALVAGSMAAGVVNADKAENWGKTDKGIGSSWRVSELKEEKEKLTKSANSDVLSRMDDKNGTAASRSAAALEAMERGLLSSSQANVRKEQIKRELGGSNKDGSFKDKKVGNYFEAIAERSNISTTRTFEKYNSQDAGQKAEAEKDIKAQIESGSLTLDKLDSGAIRLIGEIIASSMPTDEFASQFSRIKDQGKKDEIMYSLRNAANKDTSSLSGAEKTKAEDEKMDAKKKLGRVTDIDSVASSQAEKEAILGDFNIDEISDIFRRGTEKQKDAIKNALTGMTDAQKVKVFSKASSSLTNDSPQSRSLLKEMGIGRNFASSNSGNQGGGQNQGGGNTGGGQNQGGGQGSGNAGGGYSANVNNTFSPPTVS